MRALLLGVAVLGFATLADGQMGGVRKVILRSDSQRHVGRVTKARGNVTIFHGTAVITADEADLTEGGPNGPIDIQLRGNVHVHVNIAPE